MAIIAERPVRRSRLSTSGGTTHRSGQRSNLAGFATALGRIKTARSIQVMPRRQLAVFCVCALSLSLLFAVTLAQALLVSPQHRIDGTNEQIESMRLTKSQLEADLAKLSGAGEVTSRAAELGMVVAGDPVYISEVRSDR